MYTLTDLFCGAGGSSTGATQTPGVQVKMAANHWQLAIDVHNANHPETDHAIADIHKADPHYFPKTDMAWMSPECTKWTQASGEASSDLHEGLWEDPLADEAKHRSRMLMFDVPRFADVHRYRSIIVENVVDVAMRPKYAGAFHHWLQTMTNLGYDHRVISLNSMHAQLKGPPAPQSRDRIYVAFWRRGDTIPDFEPALRPMAYCPRCDTIAESRQAWKPNRWVGRYRQQYTYIHAACGTTVEPGWLPASSAIDWSLPGTRIGDRTKPLAEKTRRRIAAGIARYWGPIHLEAAGHTYDAADPNHPAYGNPEAYYRAWSTYDVLKTLHTIESKALAIPVEGRDGKQASPVTDPLRTMTTRAETALLTPFIAELRGGGSDARSVADALATICASGNHHALLQPFMLERNFEYRTRSLDDPISTLTANDTTKALISPYYGNSDTAKPVTDPLGTVTTRDHHALISPAGGSWNDDARPTTEALRSLTTREAYSLITPAHEVLRTLTTTGHQSLLTPSDIEAAEQRVDDCLFRMLEPHEVAAGMAFPGDYYWEGTRRNRVKLAGNAVTPPTSRDLIACQVAAFEGDAA